MNGKCCVSAADKKLSRAIAEGTTQPSPTQPNPTQPNPTCFHNHDWFPMRPLHSTFMGENQHKKKKRKKKKKEKRKERKANSQVERKREQRTHTHTSYLRTSNIKVATRAHKWDKGQKG
jgi:hypothetical protein